MTRRFQQFTQASDVVVRKADTGEVIERQSAYDPTSHRDIVARGNAKQRPDARSRKRRGYGGK